MPTYVFCCLLWLFILSPMLGHAAQNTAPPTGLTAKSFQDVLDKGISFSSPHPPLRAQDIAKLESIINAPLPPAYKDYLLHVNGGTVDCHLPNTEALAGYGITVHWPKDNVHWPKDNVHWPKDSGSMSGTQAENNCVHALLNMEKILWYYEEWGELFPQDMLIFATDCKALLYLIGTGPKNRGKIYAWRSDLDEELYFGSIADGFAEFLLSLGGPPEYCYLH